MKLYSTLALSTVLLLQGLSPAYAQLPTDTAGSSYTVVVPRGKVTGISGQIVTIIHPEGKRQVDDPVLVDDQTQIWLGKKQVSAKSLRLKQYLKVTGVREGDIITAARIDILTGRVNIALTRTNPAKPRGVR